MKKFLKATRLIAIYPAVLGPLAGGISVFFSDSHSYQKIIFFLCLAVAVCLQIAVNTGNDYYDSKSGLDTKESNPYNMIAQGLVTPKYMFRLYIIFFCLSSIFGLALILISHFFAGFFWGAAFLLIVHFYSAGKKPLGYFPLGELISFSSFGPICVILTHYVIYGEFGALQIVLGIIVGLLTAPMMYLNNLRDLKTDSAAGKFTLPFYIKRYSSYRKS
ncbi:MAG: 1,4-dihydroxy-2-naphthoate octaprenyltransferase [Bifidobacteriaceae bacterium]|jgi:1,4-dihydroxy-2-naphthoate octaprenyltransferase|nr:1,4-dihydroxy-2-naphthoate octaprenyltransferase [Bifidobacteriaceae bacterium]